LPTPPSCVSLSASRSRKSSRAIESLLHLPAWPLASVLYRSGLTSSSLLGKAAPEWIRGRGRLGSFSAAYAVPDGRCQTPAIRLYRGGAPDRRGSSHREHANTGAGGPGPEPRAPVVAFGDSALASLRLLKRALRFEPVVEVVPGLASTFFELSRCLPRHGLTQSAAPSGPDSGT